MSLHAYTSRDSPPSHTLLDQNFDPREPTILLHDRLKSIPGLNITGITHQASQHNIKCKSADFIFHSDIIDKIFTATIGEFIYESIGRNIHHLESKFYCPYNG